MLGKFSPAMRSFLPNLLGKKLINIHSLIRVRAREIRTIYIFYLIICLCANSNSNYVSFIGKKNTIKNTCRKLEIIEHEILPIEYIPFAFVC